MDFVRKIGATRLALGAAALIAVAAVGVSLTRDRGDAPPPPNSQASQAPVGDVASMIGQLEAKMRETPDQPDGWRMLGWAYFETGRYAESARAYEKAATLDPGKAEYWSALGEATVLAEKGGSVPPAAQRAFEKALSVDPKEPRARYYLAVRKDMAGDHKGAVDDWIALLRDAPADAPWTRDVYALVEKVAAANKIDVAGRMPPPPAAPTPAPGSAGGVATAAIPGPTPEQMRAASSLPPSQQDAMVKGMVDGLAAKLEANPGDVDGWIRLMRARMVLNDAAAARTALARAKAANPAAAARLDEAAQALGVPRN